MGVDWQKKAERQYKHQLQEAAYKRLKSTPLFDNGEEAIVTYPCHWIHEDRTLPVGTRLTVFDRGLRARIAVMDGTVVVAEVRGEAARDLHELFRSHPELHHCLSVCISDVSGPGEPFYTHPSTGKRKRKGTVQ